MNLVDALISNMGEKALAYAKRGWYVFPLKPRDKQPLNPRGFLGATLDAARIREWWREHPEANIGLWPGQSGLLVIDIDGPEGEETAARLGIHAEPTLECRTGRKEGGRHLYFKRPNFNVSNCNIGKKLDVRCDGGYVILPPSVHPSGEKYKWLGKAEEIHELSPAVIDLLRKAQMGLSRSDAHVTAARDIAAMPAIGDGERNNTLTRLAGRQLALGCTEAEVLGIVSAMNDSRCHPPLPQQEVNALVANIAAKESKKHLQIVRRDAQPEPAQKPAPDDLANSQITQAHTLLNRDTLDAPTWAWTDIRRTCGPMMPGDLLIVGSLTGNGKSTFLMSQMEHLAHEQRPTLYLPLEVDSAVCRLRWAAWQLGLDPAHVLTQCWSQLREGAKEDVAEVLDTQSGNPFIHFLPPKTIRLAELVEWCRWGKEHVGAKVVMIDHLHRMDPAESGRDYRVAVTNAVRLLKDMAREMEMVIICSAQLNRTNDPFDAYYPPTLARLKESAGIAEEADVVLMLSRCIRPDMSKDEETQVRKGFRSPRDVALTNVMRVTCAKHRLRDDARDTHRRLWVRDGKLENYYPETSLYS